MGSFCKDQRSFCKDLFWTAVRERQVREEAREGWPLLARATGFPLVKTAWKSAQPFRRQVSLCSRQRKKLVKISSSWRTSGAAAGGTASSRERCRRRSDASGWCSGTSLRHLGALPRSDTAEPSSHATPRDMILAMHALMTTFTCWCSGLEQ